MEFEPKPIEPKGERRLRLINRSDLIDRSTGRKTEEGKEILYQDFILICGEKAENAFTGLEALNPGDPDFALAVSSMQKRLDAHLPPLDE